MKYKTIYDISVELNANTPFYPGDPKFNRLVTSKQKSIGECNISEIKMGSHTATHLDAPFHYISDGKTIDEINLTNFIKRAHVVEIENKKEIPANEIKLNNYNEGDAILFKTENSRNDLFSKNEFFKNFVYLSEEATKYCVKINAGLIGVDYLSVDPPGSEKSPGHINLLSNNIVILEGVNLSDVPEGIYTLLCLPLKIKGGDGSPTRAVLLS
jgi:arylformamidase